MSFINNGSKLTGKSITNSFNVIADNITVERNELVKGNLTVLGTTNIGSVTLENGNVNNLTVNNLTVTTPIPYTSGGTGLSTIGSPNQVLTVNSTGTGLIYQGFALTNPSTITGTGFTGTPTFNFGIESSGGGNGRGFIRTSATATELVLGSTTSDVLRLSGSGGSANLTYNSTGSSGVFQVTNGGGAITFTNSNSGTISMATAGGSITLGPVSLLTPAVNINTAGGIFNLSTGAGQMDIVTVAGIMNIGTGGGPLNISTGVGNLSITATTGILSLTTAAAGAVNIGASGIGLVNLYGSALTISSGAVNLLSGAWTGQTGLWNVTTLAFGLQTASCNISSLASITLQTLVGTIILNGTNTTMNGPTTITDTTSSPLTVSTNTNGANFRFFASGATTGGTAIILGKSDVGNESAYFSWEQNNQRLVLGTNGNANTLAISTALTTMTGNAFVSQNINWGTLTVNNNTALTVNSPKTILVRGGSGVTITLPNATTLSVGWNYIINNNSNNTITIVDFTSTVITTILSGQLANVYLITNPNTAGTWDYHLAGSVNSVTATSPIVATGTVNPVISISSTAAISLGPATVNGNLNVTNSATLSTNIGTFFSPNLTSGEANYLMLGRSTANNESLHMQYTHNTTVANRAFSMYFAGTGATQFTMQNNGTISLTGATSITASTTPLTMTITGSAPTTAVSCFQASIANGATLPITFGKSGATNLAAVIRFCSNSTLTDNYLGLGFWANDDLYKITAGGVHVWRNTTAETMVLTNAGVLSVSSLAQNTNTIPPDDISKAIFKVTNTVNANNYFDSYTLAAFTSPNPGLSQAFQPASIILGRNQAQAMILSYYYFADTVRDTFNLRFCSTGNSTFAPYFTMCKSGQIFITANSENVIRPNYAAVNIDTEVTTSQVITSFFAPNLNSGAAETIHLGRSRNSGECLALNYLYNTTAAQRVCQLAFSGGAYGNTIQLNGDGSNLMNCTKLTINSSSANPLNVTTSNDGASFGFFASAAAGNGTVLIVGKNDTANNGFYSSWEQNNQRFVTGILGNSTSFWYTANGHKMGFGEIGLISSGGTGIGNGVVNISGRNGNNQVMTFYNLSGNAVGSIIANASTTTYNTVSDYRLKSNIVPMTNTIDKILSLNCVEYNFENDPDKHYGFLAHELKEIIPIAVSGEKDAVRDNGEPIYQQVDYSKLTPFLTAALKELYSLVQTLQDRITTLESQQ